MPSLLATRTLQSVVLCLSACAGVGPSTDGPQLVVVPVASWGGEAVKAEVEPQLVTRLTLHHQGEFWPQERDVIPYLRSLQRWSRETKAWRDIPYHYIVAPDGKVYEGRSTSTPGDTNTEYNPVGHVQVMLLGNFEVQTPTTRQLDATVLLLAQLLNRYSLSTSALGTHGQHSAQTVCPGLNLNIRLGEIWTRVEKALSTVRMTNGTLLRGLQQSGA